MASQIPAGLRGAAVLLLILTLSWPVDAAVILRRNYNVKQTTKSSLRLHAVSLGDKALDEKKHDEQDERSPQTLPGFLGMMHEGSKMDIPIHSQVAVQDNWAPSSSAHQIVWLGTAVYACFGVLVAYLYYQARIQYPKTFLPQPEPGVLPWTSGFSLGLFSCLADPKICVMGFCCPCLRWADTLDQHGVMSYWPAFLIMFSLSLLSIHTQGIVGIGVLLVGVISRQKLREKFQIDSRTVGTVASDCMVWLCCQPCAIIQEAREEAVQRSTAGV